MARRLFLFVAALFSCCAKLDEENINPTKIYASVGETAVLPCKTDILERLLTVEWSKHKIALVYRDGRESHQDKDSDFKSRTSLVKKKPVEGNISLMISNVGLSDNGVFICKTIWKGVEKVVKVELIVGAVSEPKLSVVPSVDGGVTLQCEANCWFPEPEITFLDDQGKYIEADKQNRVETSTGCFKFTRTATLPAATNRVTCQVHQQQTNQTRATDLQIYIQENCLGCCTTSISIAALEAVIICGLAPILIYLYVTYRKLVEGCKYLKEHRKTSIESTAIEIPENNLNSGYQAEGIEEEQSPAVSQLPNVNNPKPPTPTNIIPPIANSLPRNRDSKYFSTNDTDVPPSSPSASTSEQGHSVHSLSRQNKPKLQRLKSRQEDETEAKAHLLSSDAEDN